MYAPGETAYPFPVIVNFTDTVQLLELQRRQSGICAVCWPNFN